MEQEYKYMVCTRCYTFNQAPFIVDAMNGFTMQQTDFPFVCTIVDDASTDGEPEVIRHYLEEHFDLEDHAVVRNEETEDYVLCFAQHKTNKNCYFAVLWLKYNHHHKKGKYPYYAEWRNNAKYIALCEGDDYWIHPMKLQHQVDFMELHPDYSMCFTNALVSYDHLNKSARVFNQIGENQEIHISELIDKWICPTPSILYKASITPLYPLKKKGIISGDWRLTLHCAACGKVWGMKTVMACYRKTESTSSMSNTYSHRADEVFLRKVPILEGLDEYTNGKCHELISQYIRYYSKMGQLVSFKKKHGMLATVLLKPLTLMEMVWKRNIRPKLDKNAPTFSA